MAAFDFLRDPNFQNLLAGIGAELDPEGIGGAIGRPAQQFNRSRQFQKLFGSKEVAPEAVAAEDIDTTLASTGENTESALTPAGTPGLTQRTTIEKPGGVREVRTLEDLASTTPTTQAQISQPSLESMSIPRRDATKSPFQFDLLRPI